MRQDDDRYIYIIVNTAGNRAWGTCPDGSGPVHWVEDSQYALLYVKDSIPLPPDGRWLHWRDPAAEFGP